MSMGGLSQCNGGAGASSGWPNRQFIHRDQSLESTSAPPCGLVSRHTSQTPLAVGGGGL